MKSNADAWKPAGRIWLWRYTENRRQNGGWHFTADEAGCASLIALLDAFAADADPGTRTLTLARTTDEIVCVPSFNSAWTSPARLRVSSSADASEWTFPEAGDPAELTVGATWLPQIRQAIAAVPRGEGDHCVGPAKGAGRLWLWWMPGSA